MDEGDHLFRLTCPVGLWGVGNTANKYHWCVWGVLTVCLDHTGFAPTHDVCAFPVYTAQAPGCSAGELSKTGPGFHGLPGSKMLSFRFLGTPQRHRLGWVHVLCPSQVQAVQVRRCLASAVAATYRLPRPSHSVFWVYNRRTFSGGC